MVQKECKEQIKIPSHGRLARSMAAARDGPIRRDKGQGEYPTSEQRAFRNARANLNLRVSQGTVASEREECVLVCVGL